MDSWTGSANPLELPDELEEALGEVWETEEQCPGVWYVSTQGDGREKGTEFYVVNRDTDVILTSDKICRPTLRRAYVTLDSNC